MEYLHIIEEEAHRLSSITTNILNLSKLENTLDILTDITILDWGFKRNNLVPNYNNGNMIDKNYKAINKEEYVFYMSYLSEVKELINSHKEIETIHYVATDGAGRLIADTINEMDEETYNHYINYHLSICEREDLIGYSGHILAITKKK